MTWTYYIEGGSTSSKMRLRIGDTREDPNGMLPEGRNFEDEELDWFYSQAGENLDLAVALAFEAAAAAWSPYPSEIRMGPESQKIPAAQYYADRAANIRSKLRKPGSVSVAKADYGLDVDTYT